MTALPPDGFQPANHLGPLPILGAGPLPIPGAGPLPIPGTGFDPMQDLRRPALLIRTARAGQGDYQRKRALKRLLRLAEPPAPGAALALLRQEEARLENLRRAGAAGYALTRHVDLLIALLAEMRLVAAQQRALLADRA